MRGQRTSGCSTRYRSSRRATFNAELPEGGLDVDYDHAGVPAGTVVHAEVDGGDRVHCVSVIDDGDRLLELDQPVYYSATLDMRGCSGGHVYIADEARIIGLSLTLAPASLAARPLEMRRGDVRSSVDRSSWSGWRGSPLLERCVDQLPRLRVEHRRAAHVVDRRRREEDDYPLELRRPLRRGALEHGPPGRVISVR